MTTNYYSVSVPLVIAVEVETVTNDNGEVSWPAVHILRAKVDMNGWPGFHTEAEKNQGVWDIESGSWGGEDQRQTHLIAFRVWDAVNAAINQFVYVNPHSTY